MKTHTKNYFEGMKIPILERFEDMYVPCEACDARAVDINHLDPRKIGGSKLRDNIENIVALCRPCHLAFEAGQLDEEELKAKHFKNIP